MAVRAGDRRRRGLQLLLPARLSLHPRYLIPAIELVLLAVLFALNPGRIERRDPFATPAVARP